MSLPAPGDDALPRVTSSPEIRPSFTRNRRSAGEPLPERLSDTNRIKPAAGSAKPAVNDSRNRCTTRAPIGNYEPVRTAATLR